MNKKQRNGKIRRSWEYPVCNICGNKHVAVVYDNMTYWEYEGVFRFVKCTNCGLVFLSPRPPISEMEKYYQQDNYFGRKMDSSLVQDDKRLREKTYKPIYSLIARKTKKGSILDIGAGTGLFLSKYKDDGWETYGMELESQAVKYAESTYGLRLKKGDFLSHTFPRNAFDVVTLNGALEHMHKPFETLKEVHLLLKKRGMVVFSVPNENSLGRKLFGINWFPWQPPRHLYHFSPATARQILKEAGFTNITIYHTYYLQNYYILFQSLRYSRSPKFEKKAGGGLASDAQTKQKSTFFVQLGKMAGAVFAFAVAVIEPIVGKGEVIIVTAEK